MDLLNRAIILFTSRVSAFRAEKHCIVRVSREKKQLNISSYSTELSYEISVSSRTAVPREMKETFDEAPRRCALRQAVSSRYSNLARLRNSGCFVVS